MDCSFSWKKPANKFKLWVYFREYSWRLTSWRLQLAHLFAGALCPTAARPQLPTTLNYLAGSVRGIGKLFLINSHKTRTRTKDEQNTTRGTQFLFAVAGSGKWLNVKPDPSQDSEVEISVVRSGRRCVRVCVWISPCYTNCISTVLRFIKIAVKITHAQG